MTGELRDHIERASLALGALEGTATYLDAAATDAIDADDNLRQAKTTLDDRDAVLLLEAVRLGVLDGKNAETRDAQFRGYRSASADWTGATAAHHDATVSAARARQQAESAAARYSVAKESVRLHTAVLGLLGRGL